MKQKGVVAVFFFGLLLLCPFLISSDNYKIVNGPDEFYFGHVSLVDIKNDGKDPLIFHEGQEQPDIAVLNFPLGPGDTIRTSSERRCEIQFDNATIIRLDTDSELKIETILAQSLSSRNKLSNLVLNRGRITVMYKEYNSKEMFQVITANAAVKLRNSTVAEIGFKDDKSTDVQVEYGKASVLFGPGSEKLEDKIIYKNERLTVLKDDTFVLGEYAGNTGFEAWNKEINKNFSNLHKGKTPLPKPIQRLPKAVFYFAQTYGNSYGEWIYDDYFGYVWRPYVDDYYPSGHWRPYNYGRWTSYEGQMFWVPEEPWGWVPYHLGIWRWNEKRGWFWIPGSTFAPACVDWAFFFGNYAWQPWSLSFWIDYGSWTYDRRLLPTWNSIYRPHYISSARDISPTGTSTLLKLPKDKSDAIKSSRTSALSRVYDWNPDSRIGRKLGVSLLYSSRKNEIYSPQLRISSRMALYRPILSARGVIMSSRRGDPFAGGKSSGAAAGSMSTGDSSSGTAGSASSGGSSSGGGSGHVRH